MARAPHHPHRDQITIPGVLEAMSDPTRLAIVLHLDKAGEATCGRFTPWASKTSLSYHFSKLREAGVIRMEISGTFRFVSLRWDDLEARFPGLLPQLIDSARQDPAVAALEHRLERQATAQPGRPKQTAA